MTVLNFDATSVAPDTGFETIPAGWYNVKLIESEMKPTKGGDGNYLRCTFEVLDGQYMNRKLFHMFNLQNANEQAVDIAYRQLSALAHAVGILQVQDSQQLHGIPLKVKVSIQKDKSGEYEDQNRITVFKHINDPTAGATNTGAPPAPQAPQGFAGQPQMQGWQQPGQAPMQQPQFQQPGQPQFQQPVQQPPVQQPVQQPWQQQPATQPPLQQQQPQVDPSQQSWQQPAAQQPWQQAPATQPAQQPTQQAQQPVQQQHPAQGANPPWNGPQA